MPATKPLDKTTLAEHKHIFETMLVRETLAEIRYLWDVQAGRAERRKGFKETLFLQSMEITASLLSLCIDKHKDSKLVVLEDFFVESEDLLKIEITLQHMASHASLRYEYLIANLLSEQPVEGVIPFARIGARRIMRFLSALQTQLTQDNRAQLPITPEFLLNGLIQGCSGVGYDGFKNHRLASRQPSTRKFTVEGAYGRASVRLLPMKGHDYNTSPLYMTDTGLTDEKSLLPQSGGSMVSLQSKWGIVKFIHDKQQEGPKYGFILISPSTHKQFKQQKKIHKNMLCCFFNS